LGQPTAEGLQESKKKILQKIWDGLLCSTFQKCSETRGSAHPQFHSRLEFVDGDGTEDGSGTVVCFLKEYKARQEASL